MVIFHSYFDITRGYLLQEAAQLDPPQTTQTARRWRLQVLRIVDGLADDAADEVEEIQVVSGHVGPEIPEASQVVGHGWP